MTKTTQRVFGLDLMRAIAILLVLFSHCRPFLTKVFPGLDGVSEIGLYGVELFFVLSGFLIGGILIKTYENETSFKSLRIFWYKRWFRTMPNYYLFLIVNIVMFSFFAPTKITEPIISYFFFLQNFAWPKTVFFSISWSLCIEEWFYMLYPSAVLAIKLIFNTSVKKAILIGTCLFILIPLCSRLYFTTVSHYPFNLVRLITICRFDAMMAGVIIAFIKYYFKPNYDRYASAMAVTGLICSVISVIVVINIASGSIVFNLFYPILLTFGYACLLPYLDKWYVNKLNITQLAIMKISLWSYSLYLINFPVRFFLLFVRGKLHLSDGLNAAVFTFLFLGISFLGSYLLFRFFETPVLAWRNRAFKEPVKPQPEPFLAGRA